MSSNATSVLESGYSGSAEESGGGSGIYILIQDSMGQRLVEGAALQMDVETIVMDAVSADPAMLCDAELIVADQPTAERIREFFQARDAHGEGVNPAIIAVVEATATAQEDEGVKKADSQMYDGLLVLPQPPAQLAAQLSLMLYAHRAFARRYRDAMDELHLNRRIFRSVTSGISVANAMDPEVPLTYVNPAFEAMTGYCLEEVLGKNCRFLQGEERDQSAVTLIREAIRNRSEITVVLKNFRKDGSAFWNELSLSPIRVRDGEVTHFVGIQTDVTARVEFEAALRESEKLAAAGRLASSIAHEINNPLESVMNLIYLAKHSTDAAATQTYLSTADSELQRVKLITAQSLRFFKQSTKPQAVHCGELVSSVLSLYSSRLSNSTVQTEVRERCDVSIVCMESEIRQVLNNLVSNAVHAMYGTGGRLLIRTRKGTDFRSNVEGVVFTVADTGCGIPKELMDSIYKAFFTTKDIGGTGLGLWISSEIVNRHKGRMLVRSRNDGPRTGTVFQMFLPYQGLGADS